MREIGPGWVLTILLVGACTGEHLGGDRQDAGAIGATPADASGAPQTSTVVRSDACWAPSLPAEVSPILPGSIAVTACAAGTGAPDWRYPQNPAGDGADDRSKIVGRWMPCNATLPGFPHHETIEFGANGRWRLLQVDASGDSLPAPGSLVPVTGPGTSGYYILLGSGQLDLRAEDPGDGSRGFFLSFAAGMDTLRFAGATGEANVYVRITPSPLNGADNPPPTSAGACSMVGTWDVPANNGPISAPAAVFSFDAAGNFVAGPADTNLCDGHTAYGTYALSAGMFQLTSNVGLGSCAWWYTAGYPAVFDDSCDHLSLTRQYDGCTGGRGYFNEPTTLTRRPAASRDAGTQAWLGVEAR